MTPITGSPPGHDADHWVPPGAGRRSLGPLWGKNVTVFVSIRRRPVRRIGERRYENNMRVMVMVKATKDSEAGVLPNERLLTEMGKFNEELVKAGVMLAGEGLQASSKGARVRFSGSKRTVIDGPFTETKE